ncbi:hypothetical protein EC957_000404 [Mortierella hygrophila]|uniref:Uncharacterized protein n=1 Tax=Mortierella hygrophila TaxID=979708 RepID=A0A9P6K336_9FUNG|nr:hypothetical protein EC957_000404 [Mortierella hygrophila]
MFFSLPCLVAIFGKCAWKGAILEIGHNADDFLFLRLATEFPNLKSFVHSEYSQFDPETLLAHLHPNHQNLVFSIAISRLHRRGCNITKGEIPEADLWEKLVHLILATISADDSSEFVQCRVKLPNARTLNCTVFPPSNLALQRLLRAFPGMGHLEIRLEKPKLSETEEDEEEFVVQSEHHIPWPYVIRTLVVYTIWTASNRVDRVFCQMDFLVRLDVDWTGRRMLKELGRVCTNLKYARLDLRERCFRELVGLCVGYIRLKECRGSGHDILSDNIIGSAEWTCFGIKKLEMDVLGILRPSRGQESRLNTWRLNGNMGLTEEEQDATDLQLFSYEIQRQVYVRLGRPRELEELYLGQHIAPKTKVIFTKEEEDIPEGLEMKLASGLAELGVIGDLQKTGFGFTFGTPGLFSILASGLKDQYAMIETPNFLAYISSSLEPESCLACVPDFRLWHQVHTPLEHSHLAWKDPIWLWTIDFLDTTITECDYIWTDPSSSLEKIHLRIRRIRTRLADHARHIRHLTVDRDRDLQGAFLIGLNNLASLGLDGSMDEILHDNDEDLPELHEGTPLLVVVQPWKHEFDLEVFRNLDADGSVYWTWRNGEWR